jgi:hypothetical protein
LLPITIVTLPSMRPVWQAVMTASAVVPVPEAKMAIRGTGSG